MSEGNSDNLQPIGAKENVEERREKVNCNGEALRTSEPLKYGLTSENIDHIMDSPKASSSEVCNSIDTQWAGDEQTASSSKEPSQNNHNSDSSSSEDETEGQGDFTANWYVPLPQDPQESDEEGGGEGEDSEQWSEAATGGTLQAQHDGEEEGKEEGQGASTQQVEEVKAASRMEDSEF